MDWCLTQIEILPNVSVYPGSPMTVKDVLETGVKDVIIATGATWRRDGIGRPHWQPLFRHELPHVYTPGDIMAGHLPTGKVVVFGDEHYYFGSVIAEKLTRSGCEVTMVSPATVISSYTQYTLEQKRIQNRLLGLGVDLQTQVTLHAIHSDYVTLSNDLTETEFNLNCDAVVLVVVARLPKTRSGKILRGTIKRIADNTPYKMPATIDDPVTLPMMEEAMASLGLGKAADSEGIN
jgi:dimethylamine/trimethylamine dehydrogenase